MYWIIVLILFGCHRFEGKYVFDKDVDGDYKILFNSTDREELMFCFYGDSYTHGINPTELVIENSSFPHFDEISIIHDFRFKVLTIRKSEIATIDDDLLVDQTRLLSLDLSYNKIEKLNFLTKSLDELQALSLGHNQIDFVDGNIFEDLENLFSIDLSYNNIKNFTSITSSSLRVLNFSHNSLTELGNSVFNFRHLQEIDLSYNKLTRIDAEQFSIQMNLRNLIVNDNELVFIDLTITAESINARNNLITNFSITELKFNSLDLSNNKVNQANMILDVIEYFEIYLLSFSNNSLKSLDFLKLKKGKNITINVLDLSTNELTFLDPEIFLDLRVNILILTQNKLKQVDFASIPSSMKGLVLSFNPIDQIKASNSTLAISILDLSHCKLKKLDGTPFQKLENLFSLNLGHNSIKTVTTETFQNLVLTDLNLSHNSIKSLPTNMFFGSWVEVLDISNNPILGLESNVFNNSEILNITLDGLILYEVDEMDFAGLNALSFLNLSSTGIKKLGPNAFSELKNLKGLSLDFNHIAIIPENFLNKQNSLKKLSLIGNPVSKIHPRAFSYKNNLQSLNLTIVGELSEKTFFKLTKLKELNLISSNITKIRKDVFRGLSSLEKLLFKNSNISDIDTGAFNGLNLVIEIDSQNLFAKIKTMKSHLFNGLKRLEHLNLSSIGIETLEGNAFSGLDGLLKLNLSFNNISDLPKNAYVGLKQLKILDLSHNNLTGKQSTFPIGIFRELVNLNELHLQHNKIIKFHIGEFSNLHNLHFLNLSHNQLSYLDRHVLFPLKNLSVLDINSNYVIKFDYEFSIKRLNNLKTVGIGSNKWRCENLTTMLNSFQKYNVDFLSISNLEYERENVDGVHCVDICNYLYCPTEEDLVVTY